MVALHAEDEKLKAEGWATPTGVYFMRQTIGNACGTIGALHAIANNREQVAIGAQESMHAHTWAPQHKG